MGRIFIAALGAVFFLVGAGLGIFLGLPTITGAKASESWPTVEGVVIESRVETKKSTGSRKRGGQGTTYQAIVVYDYEVDGQAHSSDRIWFGGDISTSNQGQMRDTVKQYPEGSTIQVYYDPDSPSEAVLQPGAFLSSWFMMIFSGVFAAIGGATICVAAFGMGRKDSVSKGEASNPSSLDDFDRSFPDRQ